MEDEQPAREANKVCGVCGDRALGYNFNAVSCESCKAFFRRNAVKNKDFRCPFTENCAITPVTRRFCQKCRLDKCFSIGMRKEYIMSEEDKVLKRQKIEQNRAKKRPKSDFFKSGKVKKGPINKCNFDDASMSVNSVASTVSETYFWESDKKYADLDANRQHAMDSMSPVTAASVPSPLSPAESTDIGGSKTLDMLKESPQNAIANFGKYEPVSCCSESDANLVHRRENIEPDTQSASRFEEYSHRSPNDIEEKSPSPAKKKFISSYDHPKNCSIKYDCDYEANVSSYSNYEHNSMQHSPSCMEDTCDTKTIFDLSPATPVNVHTMLEESTLCQKSKETCNKKFDFSSDSSQNPELITRFVSNPSLVAKIMNNEDVIKKILTDPEIVNKLSADPQVSEFFEGISHSNKKQNQLYDKTHVHYKEASESSDLPNSTLRHILKFKQRRVENPILTDLITNRNSEGAKEEQSEPGASTDINKNVTDVTRDVVQDVQRIPIAANSIESILCEAIKLEFSAYSALGGTQISRELNDAERAKLNELIVANKSLLAPLDDDLTNLVGEECRFKNNFGQSDPMLLDVINLTAIAIRRLIKMSKKINAFKNMCQEDQLALLKGGCTEMLILRSALNYDHDKDMWKIPHSQEKMSNIKVDVLKEAKGNLYAEHARFVRTFDPRWRDENIILILSAIALFTPDRPRVIHSDVIKLEQNSYYYLLRRYLESIYPGCEAKSTFLKLIQKISELHRLNDEVVGVYLNVNPSSVEPLLIEIFDLKH